jgi:uncharacterized protein (DUF58 family)
MKKSRIFFLAILLLANFLLLDFPGAKIVLYGAIILLLIVFIYTRAMKKRLSLRRFMDTDKVFAGLTETTSLIVSNDLHLPINAIQITDYADLNISIEQAHRFLFSIDKSGNELISYNLFGRKRGKHKVGPTTVAFTDILGINSFKIEINTAKDITVFPNIYQINNMHYKSMQPYGAIKNKVPIFEDPTIMIGLKEYQFGDEIKKINWKVSAKYDKLFVNTYQPSISSSSVIILDLLEDNYNFRNRDFYMEQAIEVTASLVKKLFLMRQEVGIAVNCRLDNNDAKLKTNINKGEAHFTSLLGELAVIESSKRLLLKELIDPVVLNLSWGISIYVITTRLDEMTLYKLISFQQSGHSITIINIGPELNKELSLWNIGFQAFYAEIEGNIINLLRI